MERQSDLRSKFGVGDEVRSDQELIFAMDGSGEGVERKIDGEIPPGGLLNRTEIDFGSAAQKDALGRAELDETAIIQAGDIETEAVEIVGEENGAADFGVDGVAVVIREGQPESQRSEFVHIGDEAPAMAPERLHFELLLMPALIYQCTASTRNAAIEDPVVAVLDGSVLKRTGAKVATLAPAPAAEVFKTKCGIHPGFWGPVEGIANDEAFAVAVADDGHEKTGLPNMLASRSGGIGPPEKRDTIEAEVGVDQSDGFLEGQLRFRSIKLPGGMRGIADGEPGVANDVEVGGKALDFASFKVQRVLRYQEGGVGVALEFYGAVDVVENAVFRGDIENGIVALEMLVFKVEDNVPVDRCLGSGVVVLGVVGAQAHAGIGDVHITIGDKEVAFSLLRAAGGDFRDAAGRSGETDLLGGSGNSSREKCKEERKAASGNGGGD